MDFLNDKEKTHDLLWFTRTTFFGQHPDVTEQEYNNTLDKMWEQLGDIPVDESGTKIEEPFYNWEKGANKEKIWHWFDEKLEEGIGKRYFN